MIKIEDAITYNHLVKAYFHCRKGKSFRENTIKYHMHYQRNLLRLMHELLAGTYKIKDLYSFIIYEPKKRNITANQFEDKIVQRVLCEYVLEPSIQPKLIYDNYASQPKKGTSLAIDRLRRNMTIHAKSVNWTNDGWVAICDIKKFFYTIYRPYVVQIVNRLDIDDCLKKLIRDQVYACGPEFNEYTDDPDRGLCIGFQTSQWLAVYVMNSLDHFIKEELHVKCYGRYMDDFYMIHKDRDYLEYSLNSVKLFVEQILHLKLNKKTHIHPFSQGICFLGYHCIYDLNAHDIDIVIRTKSIHKMKKRIKKLDYLIKLGRIKTDDANMSLRSWYSYAEHGKTEKAMNAYKEARAKINGYSYNDGLLLDSKTEENTDIDGFIILKSKSKSVLFPKQLSIKEYKTINNLCDIKNSQTKKDVRLIDTRKKLRNNMYSLLE